MRRNFVREDIGDIFIGVSDDELAQLAAKKQPHAFSELLNRFTNLMLYKISCIRPVSADADDLMQECSLALLDAVNRYSETGGASFKTFASVCIDNRLKSVLRRSEREKNKPLIDYVEISDYLMDSELNGESNRGDDPEEQMLISESAAELRQRLTTLLSEFELKVFILYLEGRSYDNIAAMLRASAKAVDNALQRVRRKLRIGLQ